MKTKKSKSSRPLEQLKKNALTGLIIVTPLVLIYQTSFGVGLAWGFWSVYVLTVLAERVIEP